MTNSIRTSNFEVRELHNGDRAIPWSHYHKRKTCFRDCFITPSGEVIPIDKKWHHIEVALGIIKDMDKKHLSKVEQLKKDINYWTEAAELRRYDYEYYMNKVNECRKELKELGTAHIMKDYENVNRNRGLDSAEFLIIHYGYIAMTDWKLVYKSTTRSQRELINCYSEIDEEGEEVLIPLNDKQLKFKNEREKMAHEIIGMMRDRIYYNDSANAFHCPSGVPRVGWKSRAESVNRSWDNKINSKSFQDKMKKYGLQIPKTEWTGMNSRVIESTVYIEGFMSELLIKQ